MDITGTSSLEQFAVNLGLFVAYVMLGIVPVCGILYVIYFLLTLPMRRRERARLFLDLLELGLNEGRSPELAIQGPASSRDRSLGVRFHLLAAWLEQGMSLGQALEKVPRLLPPQICAMLKTGERIGDLRKILPACRQLLLDGVSHVRGAMNYLVLLLFVATPISLFIQVTIRVKVLPSFEQIFMGMGEGRELPAFTRLVFATNGIFTAIQAAVFAFLLIAFFFYVGGPRLREWEDSWWPNRRLIFPWTWKRRQRDFSAMLVILLDAGVPENEAVRMAGESTASPALRHGAELVSARLNQGEKLPDALSAMDKSGELAWRISNALRRGKGFLRALKGWHEALDARAFQLEQTAAQITTSSLVLLNGLIVGAIACAIFLALINLLNQAALW